MKVIINGIVDIEGSKDIEEKVKATINQEEEIEMDALHNI